MVNKPESKLKFERVFQWLKRKCNKYYANIERKITATKKVKDLYKYISFDIKHKDKPTTALLSDDVKIATCEKERAMLFARSFFSYVIAIPLCTVFKRSLLTGEVPQFWKFAITSPLPKKVPHKVAKIFRGINITSFVCRVL